MPSSPTPDRPPRRRFLHANASAAGLATLGVPFAGRAHRHRWSGR